MSKPNSPMEQIYRDHAKVVYRYLLSLTRKPDIAEELTQETFYQAVKSVDRYDGTSKVSTWLCGIAKNMWLAYLRKHPQMDPLSGDELAKDDTEKEVFAKVERVLLMRSLHRIEEPYREILYLRIFGELSFREIGDIVGASENTTRVQYYRGREKLRKEIEDEK